MTLEQLNLPMDKDYCMRVRYVYYLNWYHEDGTNLTFYYRYNEKEQFKLK